MDVDKKIIISYLPQDMNHHQLRVFLMETTPGLAVSNTVLNESKTGNKGYGFATYWTVEQATNACAILDGMPLNQKILRANVFQQREESSVDTHLHVRGLPEQWGDAELHNYSNKFGKVVHGKILQEKWTGKSLQTGFVRFTSKTDADKVIALHENTLCGIIAERQYDKKQIKAFQLKKEQDSHVFVADVEGKSRLEVLMYFKSIINKEVRKCQVENGTGILMFANGEAAKAAIEVTNMIPDGLFAEKLFP